MVDLSIVFGMFTSSGHALEPGLLPGGQSRARRKRKQNTAVCDTAVEVKVEGPGVIAAMGI